MINIPKFIKAIFFGLILLFLAACSGKEERKVNYYKKAEAYYNEKNYTKAGVELRNALQIDPKYTEARFLYGQVLEKKEELRAAFQTYRSVFDENPDFMPVRISLARLYTLAGVMDKAAELVDAGLKTEPNNASLITLRAALDAQSGKLESAIKLAETAYKIAPNDELTIGLLASLYKQDNKIDQAADIVTRGIKVLPNSLDLYSIIIDLESSRNNLDLVKNYMEEVIRLEPNKLGYRIRFAQFYIFKKDLPSAEEVLRQAIKDIPDQQDPKLALVDFLWSQSSEAEANKEISRLMLNEPKNSQLKLSLGEFLERQGRSDQAEKIFKEIIERFDTDPAAIAARNRLAVFYLSKKNDPVKAMALVEEVLEENPKDSDALILRANMALYKGDAQTAITDLRAVLRDQPNSAPLMRALAKAHIQNNELSLAEETLRSALQANPADNLTRKELGQLLVVQGKADQARAMLEQLAKSQSGGADLDVIDSQFRAEVLAKDYVAAQRTAEKRQQLRPKEALGWYFAGLVAEAKGEKAEARKQFEVAQQKQPDGAEPLVALVRMDIQEGQRSKAMQRIEKMLAINSGHAIALNLKGELFLLEKNLFAAEAAFRKSAEVSPDWWAPYRGIAQVLLSQQKIGDAINIYRTGIDKAKKDSGVLSMELAGLLEGIGKQEEAIQVYEQWLKREPKASMAANNLAMLYLNYRTDKASLDSAVKLAEVIGNSNDPNLVDTRGWIKYKAGDYSGALTLLQQAVKAAPENRVMKYHLGMVQWKLNNAMESKANLQAALKDNVPFAGMDEAKKTLALINKR